MQTNVKFRSKIETHFLLFDPRPLPKERKIMNCFFFQMFLRGFLNNSLCETGDRGANRVNYWELENRERYFLTDLILAYEPVDLPVNTIQAGRKQIARYPLVSVMPSLCVHFGDTHRSREIKLDPLVVIFVSCTPGSHVRSTPYSAQSSQPSCMMFVVLRRRGNLGITESSNQWITTHED